MSRSVAAAVIAEPHRIAIEERPLPDPGEGEIRFRVEGCGICGSDFPVWEGRPWFDYPCEAGSPGHEAWGYVDAVGRNVSAFREGDRIAALGYHSYAGVDVAAASMAVKLPRTLDGKPFPGEPLGCAVNIIDRSGIRPGQTVAVVGIGFLGALLAELAMRRGARVIVLAHRRFARETAAGIGIAADDIVPMEDHREAIETVKKRTGGRLCERVIEATGLQWPLDLAGELTAERGRLVIAGYHQDGLRQVNMQLWNWRGIDVINAHERDPVQYIEGIRKAVRLAENGTFNPWPLLTHRFSLSGLNDAFTMMRDRPHGYLKAYVVPE